MTVQALDRLGNGFSDLLDVLDSDDIARVEAVLAEVRDALEEVRAQGAWRHTHEVTGRIREIMPLVEAARVRVNFLTDVTPQPADRLAFPHGHSHMTTHKRSAQRRARKREVN